MSVDGTYNVTMSSPMGKQTGSITLASNGSELTGSMSQMGNTIDILNGAIDGETLSWESKVTSPMPMTMKCTAKVEGDTISGEVKLGAFGTASFEGTRT